MKKKLLSIAASLIMMLVVASALTSCSSSTSSIKPRYRKASDVPPLTWRCNPSFYSLRILETDDSRRCARVMVTLEGYPDSFDRVDWVEVVIFRNDPTDYNDRVGSSYSSSTVELSNGKAQIELEIEDITDLEIAQDLNHYCIRARAKGIDYSVSHGSANGTMLYESYVITSNDTEKTWYYSGGQLFSYDESDTIKGSQRNTWSYTFWDVKAAAVGEALLRISNQIEYKDGTTAELYYSDDGKLCGGSARIGSDTWVMTLDVPSMKWTDDSGAEVTGLIQSVFSGEYEKVIAEAELAREKAEAEEAEKAAQQQKIEDFKEQYWAVAMTEDILLLESRIPDKCYYFFDLQGNQIGNSYWTKAEPFSDGLAYVESPEKKGYIDKNGNFVIELQGDSYGYSFEDGIALVKTSIYDYRYIDTSGNVVLTLLDKFDTRPMESNDSIIPYLQRIENSENVRRNSLRDDIQIGYMNMKGEIIIPARFKTPNDLAFDPSFSDGLAPAVLDDEQELMGYINTKGEVAIQPQWRYAYPFSEGMARVYCEVNGVTGYGFINQNGELVIPPMSEYFVGPFSSGFAKIFNERGSEGYIDKSGNIVIEPQYSIAHDFSGKYAMVEYGGGTGRWAVIDKEGNVVF